MPVSWPQTLEQTTTESSNGTYELNSTPGTAIGEGENMMAPTTPTLTSHNDDHAKHVSASPSKADQRAIVLAEITPSPILYRLEWTDTEGMKQPPFISNVPFNKLQVTADIDPVTAGRKGGKVELVLEVVTKITGSNKLLRGQLLEDLKLEFTSNSQQLTNENSDRDNEQTSKRDIEPKIVQLEDVAITKIGTTKLIIHSSTLLQTLRSIINYYPKQNLTGDAVEIPEPYSAIVHHMAELEAIVKDTHASKSYSQKVIHDVTILLEFMSTYIQKNVHPIEERLSRTHPVIKYEDLWYLFKPGEDIYLKSLDKIVAAVVMETEYKGFVAASTITANDNFEVSYWVMSSDGAEVGREDDTELIPGYKGEREVTSLAAFPCRFWDKDSEHSRRKTFEKRGKLFYILLRAGHKQMQYDGKTFPFRNKTYRGPIIVDVSAALRYDQFDMDDKSYSVHLGVQDDISGSKVGDIPSSKLNDSSAKSEPSKQAFRWAAYDGIIIKSTETLSNHQYFLLSPFVPGFALKEKRWKLFDIDNISELTEIDITYQNLVIDHKDQEIIRAIAHPQVNTWKLDFVQGKGEGQIVLLHGPPGVGKTYTVECISESTGRPLIALTIADIGIDEKRVETELIKWFTLAEGWKAILLIDEADIFLERRKGADIARNSLVSVFLRKMEYFRGLLFLTTNRIGQIDDAFLSRVHIVLGYGPLDDSKRKKIWNGFFRKLERDMSNRSSDSTNTESKIEVSKYAREYVLEDREVLDLKWNGREIRNAFQTAISLAGYQAVMENKDQMRDPEVVDVRKEHFESVVQMSRAFHTYMDSIINKGEAQRARARMERNDDFEER